MFVSIHALLLSVLEHLNRRVIKAVVVNNIESDSRVQSSFLDLLCQSELNQCSLKAAGSNFLAFFLLLTQLLLLQHSVQLILVLYEEEAINSLDLLDGDFESNPAA